MRRVFVQKWLTSSVRPDHWNCMSARVIELHSKLYLLMKYRTVILDGFLFQICSTSWSMVIACSYVTIAVSIVRNIFPDLRT